MTVEVAVKITALAAIEWSWRVRIRLRWHARKVLDQKRPNRGNPPKRRSDALERMGDRPRDELKHRVPEGADLTEDGGPVPGKGGHEGPIQELEDGRPGRWKRFLRNPA